MYCMAFDYSFCVQLPPGLENWDPSAYLETCLPILLSVLGVHLTHEAGHRIAAAVRDVKLGPSFFIPFAEVKKPIQIDTRHF
jgi:hypothetical protein